MIRNSASASYPFSDEIPQLLKGHLAHLQASAISLEIVKERGYRSVLGKTPLREVGFSTAQQRAPGILIPLYGVDGNLISYQYRPDNPRTNSRGKIVKYEHAPGSSLRLDCPPRCKDKLKDPSIPLWITEGVKKEDALASHNLCAIGLSGVWGFKGKNRLGGITFLADWDEVAVNDRDVYIVFDSDVMDKPEVAQALLRLSEHLARRKANIYQVTLPSPTGVKMGVDDFLLRHQVNKLVALAKPISATDVLITEKEARVKELKELADEAIKGHIEPKVAIEKLRELGEYRHKRKVRSTISYIVINVLRANGFFVRAPESRYYFYSPTKELLPLDSFAFGALLNTLFGLNQSEVEFTYVLADANTEAHAKGRKTTVYQFAFYNKREHVLYLDRFNGTIYRLDGERVDVVDNGTDEILFIHSPTWEPYEYLEGVGDMDQIAPTLIDDINFVSEGTMLTPEEQRLCFSLWLTTVFFESRQPTKPLLLLVGEKGSGKTTALRRVLHLLFGRWADVSTMERDREDAFTAVITNYPLAVFDNVDGRIPWLNDRLATAATGGLIQRRRLYTTNELASYFPKCFIAMTSRLPTFKREDVADRLLILTVGRLNSFRSEEEMLAKVDSKRNELWTELINDLNEVIVWLKKNPSRRASGFRLADWASLCLEIAESQGLAEVFLKILGKLSQQQSTFVLEDDPLYVCLQIWLDDHANQGKKVDASQLFGELRNVASSHNMDWPYQNVRSFAKRLGNIRSNLQDFFDIDTKLDARKRRWYSFRPKTAPVGGMTI
jgi:hypothetical protein